MEKVKKKLHAILYQAVFFWKMNLVPLYDVWLCKSFYVV